MFTKIVKRNGTHAAFDSQKITNAIAKAGRETSEFADDVARRLTIRVLAVAHDLYTLCKRFMYSSAVQSGVQGPKRDTRLPRRE